MYVIKNDQDSRLITVFLAVLSMINSIISCMSVQSSVRGKESSNASLH